MTTLKPSLATRETVQLAPSYRIPIVLILGSIPLLLIQPWWSLVLAIFGLFLLFQTLTIRLQFTPSALEVYRSGKMIRTFPYDEWQNWEIFWNRMPILFYFKEIKSIHFLPIIFSADTLKTCLEERCPKNN